MNLNWERADNLSKDFWSRFVIPEVTRIKGSKCEWCFSQRYLELHHTDYIDVNINTLKLLCKSCHRKEHYRLKKENIILRGL